MPRNRIIYQSEALYAGPSPATGSHFLAETLGDNGNGPIQSGLVKQLQRVQTANYSFTVDRQDVNQFGQLAAIDRVILTSPTVSLDFSYLLANLSNEKILGFTIHSGAAANEVSAISGILNGVEDERNYFIRTVPEGNDAVNFTTTGGTTDATKVGVIGIGNGFITSYSTEGSVGNFPTVTVNVEGLNMAFQQGITGNIIPAINPVDGTEITGKKYVLPVAVQSVAAETSGISTLRPGDIQLDLPGVTGAAGLNIQSYTLSFDLARTPIERLGSKFAFARSVDFPLTVTLSVDAQVTDFNQGTLAQIVSGDSSIFYTPQITINSPTGASNTPVLKYTLKRAKLDSQEFSSDIGANKTVTLTFSSQVGGPQDKNNGLFISGASGSY